MITETPEQTEVEVWKVIDRKHRMSCYTTICAKIAFANFIGYSEMRKSITELSDFVLHYPVGEWTVPKNNSRIYAFKSYALAEEWLDNYFEPTYLSRRYRVPDDTYQRTSMIVKAIGINPKENVSIREGLSFINNGILFNEELALFWQAKDAPKGTVTVEKLKCLE